MHRAFLLFTTKMLFVIFFSIFNLVTTLIFYMRFFLFLYIASLFFEILSAQNLVPNPGMETTTGCGGNGALSQATGWMNPPPGFVVPDLYTPCASSGNGCSNFNPLNGMGGCSNPCQGNNYTGQLAYYTSCPNCKEYIQKQLSSPLVAGTTYFLSFVNKLAPFSRYGCNKMAMYVSVAQPNQASNQPILVTPQIQGGMNVDKNNWTQVSGTYVATGGENWVTIGVFDNNTGLTIFDFGSSASACLLANAAAYYLVDNVWVAPLGAGAPPACGANTSCPIVLPIELVYFNAGYEDKVVKLKWATATEVNSDVFIVERSYNGESFEEIKQISAAGNSSEHKEYTVTDEWPLSGLSYYRLKQSDKDGTFKYSDIKAISSQDRAEALSVQPNPADNYIDVIYDIPQGGNVTLKVYDMLENLVYSNQLNADIGYNKTHLDVSEFKKGVYFIYLNNAERIQQIKFVKL
jgi:hypothetical protein